jgi:maleamate amidohydrolase
VVIDFVHGFTDPNHVGGGNIGPAIAQTVHLLSLAWRLGWPIAPTRVVYADDGSDAGVFARKVPALLTLTETSPLSQIVPELTPPAGELVIAWATARSVRTRRACSIWAGNTPT